MKRLGIVKELVEIREAVRVYGYNEDLIIQKIEEPEKKENRIDSVESPVKTKRKESIIKLLSEKGFASSELSSVTGMSRTRCNEYLRELEKDGMAKGIVKNKKKFYRLARWEKQ